MSDDETITLTDLARLAGVGRNAVSNWRRREPDFPSPVDDSARRPRFSLADIEAWAAVHDRRLDITPADRLWFTLQGAYASAEHSLQAIAAALGDDEDQDPALAAQLKRLREGTEAADLFEFFIARAREATGTGTGTTGSLASLVDIAATCSPARGDLTVFDPACDEGDLLSALCARLDSIAAVKGRDLSATQTAICAQRLRLLHPRADVAVAAGDSLLSPLPGERFDLVICDPPFNIKDWGHDRLPAGDDPRGAYGTPPRTEPELAWALHCLALLAPGGVAVVRMPAMVAHRRSGRRIRSELLRWGALRAVVDHADAKAHIWILGPRTESSQLLVSTGADFAQAWETFSADPHALVSTAQSVTVPLMRLWDEDVDISPAVYLAAGETDVAELDQSAGRLASLIDAAGSALPRFTTETAEAVPETSLGDLERDGQVTLHPGGETPAETTGVIVDPLAAPTVRIGPLSDAAEGQWALACDAEAVDPGWLAAVLTARMPTAAKRTATGARRRLLSVKVPRVPLAEQHRRGAAFARLLALRDSLEEARDEAAALADDVATGLVAGTVAVDEDH